MPIRTAVVIVQVAHKTWKLRSDDTAKRGDDAMKSPFQWCLVVIGLLAAFANAAKAESDDEEAEDNCISYKLSEPFNWTEPDSGFRVAADVLIWTRTTTATGTPVIGGPESFTLGGLSNGFVGGYRIGGSWLIDPNYELEGVWTTFSDWTANGGGLLSRAISFNNGQGNTLVDPSGNANFINTGTFFRPVFDAAMDPLANPAIQNYAFLKGNSTYTLNSFSSLHDTQVNFKTRRSSNRRFAFGIGYRNVGFDESTTAVVSGTFGTNDIPAGGTTHTILTDQALTKHGLTLLSGAADGWTNTPANPMTLSMLWNGTASNQMNGIQATTEANLLQRGPFSLEGVIRKGIFYNRISGTAREVYAASGSDDSVYGRSFADDRDVVSFVGNAGLNGVYSVNDFVRFRAGYEVMLLTNMAVAGNQQNGISYNSVGNASYSVQGGSNIFFHGARAGLELIW